MTPWMSMRSLPPLVYGVDAYPPFTRISLGTTGRCNRSCSFCVSNKSAKGLMSHELFTRLAEQLRGFRGVVQYFNLNEPLMDPHRLERIAFIRAVAPRCTIHLTSNWEIPWRQDADKGLAEAGRLFSAGVNSLNLNDYDGKGYDRLAVDISVEHDADLVDHCWKRLSPRKRVVSCGPLPTTLHHWGSAQGESVSRHCARPHRHMVVCWDGRVPLCCAIDVTKCEWMGDANTQTLDEIWQSRRMWEYRARLQEADRVWDCEHCDFVMNGFPHVVRRVVVPE